jgi:lipoic acid synthetase
MTELLNTLKGKRASQSDVRHPEKQKKPDTPVIEKPSWIRVKAPVGKTYLETKGIVSEAKLNTVSRLSQYW